MSCSNGGFPCFSNILLRMLEGQRCVFDRPMPSSCEQESNFVYLYNRLTGTGLGKRPLDGESEEEPYHEEAEGRRKSPKTWAGVQVAQTSDESDHFYCNYFSLDSSTGNSGEADEKSDLPEKSDVDSEEVDEFLGTTEHPDHGDDHDHDSDPLIVSLGREMSLNCLLRCSPSDYGILASLNRSFRRLIQSGELYKLRRQENVLEHLVYFSCNVLQWDAFNPNCQRWMHLPGLPPNECFMCSDKESLAVGSELLLFGREIMSQIVFKYSILTNSWSSGAKMNTPRCLFASASLGTVAIVAGGCDTKGVIHSSAELYKSEMQTWTPLPSMNVPRKNCSGFSMDGRFYVVGGLNDGGPVTSGEEFDMDTRSWRIIPNMFPEGSGAVGAPPLVAVVNNQLYSADHTEKELRRYDKGSNAWITLGRLPERSVSVNGWGLAFRACGERLIVIGGQRAAAGGSIELYSWIPSDEPVEWVLIGRKPSGSFVYNCAVMSC